MYDGHVVDCGTNVVLVYVNYFCLSLVNITSTFPVVNSSDNYSPLPGSPPGVTKMEICVIYCIQADNVLHPSSSLTDLCK